MRCFSMTFIKGICLLPLLFAGLFSTETVNKEEAINGDYSATSILEAADYNYTRTTTMFFNADAYNEIKDVNYFEFTQTRTTLWTKQGLFMHNNSASEGVNSGYLNQNGNMLHYYLKNGHEDINGTKDSVVVDRNDGQYDIHEFEGFGTLHKIKYMSLNNNLASYFSPVEGVENRYQLTFDDSLSNKDALLKEFMYFIAPCYTNPLVDGENYLTFDRLEISCSTDLSEVNYYLYVDASDFTKLDTDNSITGLFATAVINNINTTKIAAIEDYLAN